MPGLYWQFQGRQNEILEVEKNWVFIFCLLDIISFTITCFQKHLVCMYNFSDIIVEYHICMQVINILVK